MLSILSCVCWLSVLDQCILLYVNLNLQKWKQEGGGWGREEGERWKEKGRDGRKEVELEGGRKKGWQHSEHRAFEHKCAKLIKNTLFKIHVFWKVLDFSKNKHCYIFFKLTHHYISEKINIPTFKCVLWGFPGGQCRGHGFEPWSGKIPHAAEQLSQCATTTKAHAPRAHAPQQEKPLQWEARTTQQ